MFNQFNIDDELVIDNNERIAYALEDIPAIFTSNYISTETVKADYRPLTILMFAIEYNLFPDTPSISHLFSMICFLFLLWALYHFFLLTNGNESFSFLITSIIACAPHSTEVIASIKNRDEILAMLFMLLAAIQGFKYLKNPHPTILVLASFFTLISLLFKTTSLPFILVFPCIIASYQHPIKKLIPIIFIQLITVAALGLFIIFVLKSPFRQGYFLEDPLTYSSDLLIHLGLILQTALHYTSKMVFPLHFGFYYGYNQIPLQSVWNVLPIISMLIHFGLIFYAIYLFILKKYVISAAIFSYLMILALYSNFPLHYQGIVGDRVLFSLLIPFAVLLASFITFINKKFSLSTAPSLTSYFWVSIIILFSVRTAARELQWKDRVTLFRSDIKHLDHSAKAHFILAYQLKALARNEESPLIREQLNKEAFENLNKATKIYPPYAQAWESAGLILASDLHQYDVASEYFKKSLDADSSAWKSAYNLALCQINLNQFDQAEISLEKTLGINPTHIPSLSEITAVTWSLSKIKSCVSYAEKWTTLDPLNPKSRSAYGFALLEIGDTVEAIPQLRSAWEFGAKSPKHAAVLYYFYTRNQQDSVANIYKLNP